MSANQGAVPATFGREGVVDRKTVKRLSKRTDRNGLLRLAGHLGVLSSTGFLVWLALGSWFLLPALLLHGAVMAFLFAPTHECSHGTAFRSRRLNEAAYWLVCLIYLVPPTMFRYSHAHHHTYTQVRGRDHDMLDERMSFAGYLLFISGYRFWKRGLRWFFLHPFGKVAAIDREVLPSGALPAVVREARIIMALYATLAVISVASGSFLLLWLWILPRFLGEPFMRWLRIAEHGDCEESGNLLHNTRTTKAPAWLHFLFWNMSYHSEHHLCPMVPFHALPALHESVGASLHPVGRSYLSVHGGVLRNIAARRRSTLVTE